jgi:hypothetical protein
MKALIIVALALALCGCGGLSRSTAKAMIEENVKTSMQDKVRYPITLGLTWHCPTDKAPIYRFLLKKQLIKVTQPDDLELTEDGKKSFEADGEHLYAASNPSDGCDIAQLNVILGHRGPVEITGIIFDSGQTMATVQFDRMITPTPLGSEFSAFRKSFNLEERISWRQTAEVFEIPDYVNLPESHTAHFVKYDDGWRIISIK